MRTSKLQFSDPYPVEPRAVRFARCLWGVVRSLIPKQDDLSDVPEVIVAHSDWSWWRRRLRWPADDLLERAQAWRELVDACARVVPAALDNLDARRSGIFGSSLVLWDHLKGFHGGWQFEGWAHDAGSGFSHASVTNPCGDLVDSRTVESFRCDIRDVECIFNSRSSGYAFESVHAFGRDYSEFKSAPISEQGLQMMLAHRGIDIFRDDAHDHLDLYLWDGRLILCNADGSHHFAGAAYIATQLERPVPLVARLNIYWLNSAAWRWLMQQYRILHVSSASEYGLRRNVALLAGCCSSMPLPPNVAAGELVLLPREAPATQAVVDLLAEHGVRDVEGDLNRVLRTQEAVQRICRQRWPAAF